MRGRTYISCMKCIIMMHGDPSIFHVGFSRALNASNHSENNFPKLESNANCEQYAHGLNLYSLFHAVVVVRVAVLFFLSRELSCALFIFRVNFRYCLPIHLRDIVFRVRSLSIELIFLSLECQQIMKSKCYLQLTFIVSNELLMAFFFSSFSCRWRRHYAFTVMAQKRRTSDGL